MISLVLALVVPITLVLTALEVMPPQADWILMSIGLVIPVLWTAITIAVGQPFGRTVHLTLEPTRLQLRFRRKTHTIAVSDLRSVSIRGHKLHIAKTDGETIELPLPKEWDVRPLLAAVDERIETYGGKPGATDHHARKALDRLVQTPNIQAPAASSTDA